MPSRTISMAAIIWLAVKSAIAIPIGVCLVAGVAVGEEYKLSDKHDVYVDYAAEQQLGEQTFKELMAFFHGEGKAIEHKTWIHSWISTLTAILTATKTKNPQKKSWKRMFAAFDKVATRHNMRLVKMAEDRIYGYFPLQWIVAGSA